ncbi:MAG: diphthine synthase [Nanoarchaeota archaeon]
MALAIIGLGLNDERDITVRGLELVKNADVVFVETYTSFLQVPWSRLKESYGKDLQFADRDVVENKAEELILKPALTKDVVLLVAGDPLSATTHTDLIARAKQHGIQVTVVHNTSVMTVVADTGLSLYKFGKTTSIPYMAPGFMPETFFDVLLENQSIGAHTLMLLDLRPDQKKFMSVNEALVQLLGIATRRKSKTFSEETKVVGCARLGTPGAHIAYGTVKTLFSHDFGPAPHCLIVPGKLHFTEEEALAQHKV